MSYVLGASISRTVVLNLLAVVWIHVPFQYSSEVVFLCYYIHALGDSSCYSMHPIITFTMEQDEGGKLSFLDTILQHKSNGPLGISRSTHKEHYLHFSFHYPQHVKKSRSLASFTEGCTRINPSTSAWLHHHTESILNVVLYSCCPKDSSVHAPKMLIILSM